MKPILHLSETLIQIKVPLPFPLRWVNSYVIRSRSGWTLIDPGLRTPEAEELWNRAMKELDLPLSALDSIVLTHHHPDHYGLSGWFQERSGAQVHISQTGKEQVRALWGEGETMSATLLELFRKHGMEGETLALMTEHMSGFLPQLSPQPELTVIDTERHFPLGDRPYRPFVTPGHAAGHVCFLDEERSELFCGDHVLPQITPNVSYIPGFDDNPLHSYLQSLEEVGRLKVDMAYPGHRDPFRTFAQRTAEIIGHHEERLAAMEDRLDEPRTSYTVCRAFFGDRLSIHQLRFALSETIAHLLYLREEGRIRELERDGVVYYAK
ncbi:MBL fold metallo-hydrolase [Paenibacillus hemerocallicola]|uniref:MBL fold metallo-hydrolase n=1 Tax=Paenibacillus hemerocallicola TaxID=1172614 RepID=A0A5C4TBX2_9BACL|nr:MBL fold metallo-hydrolase [Paenibacillus hemerocallicola]TNJ66584.1 MBL fold metallo-hydrolase [Paenibacillus hemerocallicola]